MIGMTDKELADKVVALGVGHTKEDYGKVYYVPPDGDDYHDILSAFGFVRNWRVAGALMEKWGNGIEYVLIVNKWEASYTYEESSFKQNIIVLNESLPRAITEACCKVLPDSISCKDQ